MSPLSARCDTFRSRPPVQRSGTSGGAHERSPRRFTGEFLEYPDARILFGAGDSVAALVCRGRCSYQHPLLPLAAGCPLATDPLWFAVAAALTNIPYFLSQPDVLWPPILWGLVFRLINLYQIVRIYMERRPVVLSDDEQKLYDMGFHSSGPASLSRWCWQASGKMLRLATKCWQRGRLSRRSASRPLGSCTSVGRVRSWWSFSRVPHRYGTGLDRRAISRGGDVLRARPLYVLAAIQPP